MAELPVARPFCEVVATLSSRFSDLPANQAGFGIDEALSQIGLSLPADRVTLFLRASDAVTFVQVACFCATGPWGMRAGAPGDLVKSDGIEGFALCDYPWLAERLGKYETVEIAQIEALPVEANSERRLFRSQGVASVCIFPMVAHGALVGFAKIESLGSERCWPAEKIVLTRVILDMVAGMLERKRVEDRAARNEERLQTAQRLEIVGRLAGGIAHDFNNYLTAILGYSELLDGELADQGLESIELVEIRRAADRASTLVEQILGFSRTKSRGTQLLDLNCVIAVLQKIVARVAGDSVEVVYQLGMDTGSAKLDSGRFDQVLLNLVANARDAMKGGGGVLTVSTHAVSLEQPRCVEYFAGRDVSIMSPVGLAPGRYVILSILDTGCGMDHDTRTRLFEPFFSTKRGGRGTGLGLSTVLSVVEEVGGAIVVESELGVGSAFHLFLPAVDDSAESSEPIEKSLSLPMGCGETILLVEPESLVRGLQRRVLIECGYQVLEAEDGQSASLLCANHRGPIHLLLTDLAMPRLCGREVAEQVTAARPGIRVLFTSAYAEDVLREEGVCDRDARVVEKPFALHTFSKTVREVLAAG